VAYNENNQPMDEKIIRTASEPFSVKLIADRNIINADGKDLSFVTVEIVDKNGNFCPRANQLLFFEVFGNGKLKAISNGSAIDQTPFSSNYMRAFNGKLVAIIESTETAGEITLKVFGSRLEAQTIIISGK
jgi:beta-galactosidase